MSLSAPQFRGQDELAANLYVPALEYLYEVGDSGVVHAHVDVAALAYVLAVAAGQLTGAVDDLVPDLLGVLALRELEVVEPEIAAPVAHPVALREGEVEYEGQQEHAGDKAALLHEVHKFHSAHPPYSVTKPRRMFASCVASRV